MGIQSNEHNARGKLYLNKWFHLLLIPTHDNSYDGHPEPGKKRDGNIGVLIIHEENHLCNHIMQNKK